MGRGTRHKAPVDVLDCSDSARLQCSFSIKYKTSVEENIFPYISGVEIGFIAKGRQTLDKDKYTVYRYTKEGKMEKEKAGKHRKDCSLVRISEESTGCPSGNSEACPLSLSLFLTYRFVEKGSAMDPRLVDTIFPVPWRLPLPHHQYHL